jgi:hypothetical protein
LFAGKLQDWITAGEQALAMEDPWEGFAFYLEKMCELQASDRGFNDLASMRFPGARHTAKTQARIYGLSRRIVRRAHDSAVLRADVTAEDLAFLIWAQARIIQATRTVAPAPGAATSASCSTPSAPSTPTHSPNPPCGQPTSSTPCSPSADPRTASLADQAG